MSKYNAKKVVVDGITFDSKDEALFYEYLKEQKKEGNVLSFMLQPTYTLIPSFQKKGKKYREATYTPDFKVHYKDGGVLVIDVKGFSTQQGELRRKLFEWRYPDLQLIWVTRNLKHGDEHGWIEYEELKAIRAKNKKAKKGV